MTTVSELALAMQEIARNFNKRLSELSVRELGAISRATVATLPTSDASNPGRLRFVTNGRKVGEGVGAGTGVLAYDDGVAWRRASDDTTVVA
jgi:hypothetical protein